MNFVEAFFPLSSEIEEILQFCSLVFCLLKVAAPEARTKLAAESQVALWVASAEADAAKLGRRGAESAEAASKHSCFALSICTDFSSFELRHSRAGRLQTA